METIWILIAVIVVARSAIGRAIAERIRGHHPHTDPAALAMLEQRLEERLTELEERVDFAERLLQQQRGRDELPPLA